MARVLLVDDDGLVRRGAHRLLERAGHEVWETASAKVALDLATRVQMDVVITDIYMPGMNGLQLIRELEHRMGRAHVIAMTGGGYRSPEDLLSEAVGAGARRTLCKPFAARELLDMIAQVTSDGPRTVTAPGAGSSPAAVRIAPQPVEAKASGTPWRAPASWDMAGH